MSDAISSALTMGAGHGDPEGGVLSGIDLNLDPIVDSPDTLLSTLGGWEKYEQNLAKLRKLAGLADTPDIEIRLKNVSLSATIVESNQNHDQQPTVGSTFKKMFTCCCASRGKKSARYLLENVSTNFKPGRLTLVLGKPGSGKTSLLKVISGRYSLNKDLKLEGSIEYNAANVESFHNHLGTAVSYVEQQDFHCPTLTVLETFQFAHSCVGPLPHLHHHLLSHPQSTKPHPHARNTPSASLSETQYQNAKKILQAAHQFEPELMVKLLGLENCKSTQVGNEVYRGVSGGEKKRVTLGEMLFGRRSIYCLDEISTGLDSAATLDIAKALKRVCEARKSSVIVSLLQPPPEVYAVFDDVLVVDGGRIIYHGPIAEAVPYFSSIGFYCPEEKDHADFLLEVTSSNRTHLIPEASISPTSNLTPILSLTTSTNSASAAAGASTASSALPATSEEFANRFSASPNFQKIKQVLDGPWTGRSDGVEPFKQIPSFGITSLKNFYILLARQVKLNKRNRIYLVSRSITSCLAASLYGSVFYKADASIPQVLVGSLLSCLMFMSMGQAPNISIFLDYRRVFYKQRAANFTRSLPYAVAFVLSQTPYSFLEAMIFGNIVYWLIGFIGVWYRYLYFLAMLMTMNSVLTSFFFFLSSALPNINAMQPLTFISILFFTLFSGFTILKDLIPNYWIWMYYVSPVQWAVRGLALNEYKAPDYQICQYRNIDYCKVFPFKSAGDSFLDRMQIPQEDFWLYVSFLILIGEGMLFTAVAARKLENKRFYEPPAVRNKAPGDGPSSPSKKNGVGNGFVGGASPISPTMDQLRSLSANTRAQFTPVTLAFRQLSYTVEVPASNGQPKRSAQLLNQVSGHAKPGTMTALMGSSGAGKTTLMDVIAGRKNSGKIDGSILINGNPASLPVIRRVTGYCEQMDIHSETSTVHEALVFSAYLRQDAKISWHDKKAAVHDAVELLELESDLDLRVSQLSMEQRKRLTIAVELVANPSVLFLDEPTSSLDARAAKVIMRGVKKTALTGRTVVCTIHQPSADVFFLFDQLLLLRRGGHTVFFGEIGSRAEALVAYFEAIPGVTKMDFGKNPATYMLEVIGAGTNNKVTTDFSAVWQKSALKSNLDKELLKDGVGVASPQFPVISFASSRASTPLVQFNALFMRFLRHHWRLPSYNVTRVMIFVVLSVIYVSVFNDIQYTQYQGSISGISVIFQSTMFTAMICFNSLLPVMFKERTSFYRERNCESYSAFVYYAMAILHEIPYIAVACLIFCGIYFPGVQFTGGVTFFWYWIMVCCSVFTMASMGMAFVFLLPSQAVAVSTMGIVNIFFVIFSGFNPPRAATPKYWQWMFAISPNRYSVAFLATTVFAKCDEVTDLGCQLLTGNIQPLMIDGVMTRKYTMSQLLSVLYEMKYDERMSYIGGILLIALVFNMIAVSGARWVNHTVR